MPVMDQGAARVVGGDRIPLFEVERGLMHALAGGGAVAPDDGTARDRAVVGRAMDTLAAALGVSGYATSHAACPDRKSEDEIGTILRAAGFQARANGLYKQLVWRPIATATLEGLVDLYAKSWRADRDDFVFARFSDCRWDKGDSMCNRRACWSGLPAGWHATHWMPAPDGPECPAYARTTPE